MITQDAILSRVEYDTNGGCWLWAGWRDCRNGYGRICRDRKIVKAHRASYGAFVCDPGEKWVLHKCDVRVCVNPDHLYLGGIAENTADMVRRNRACRIGAPKGEESYAARLTDDAVREIRASKESSRQLAKRLPVCASMIRRIRRGQAWSHVGSAPNPSTQGTENAGE